MGNEKAERIQTSFLNAAEKKALAVAEKCTDCVVIGADTIVVLGGKILGKPKDEADAFSMLKDLSGIISSSSNSMSSTLTVEPRLITSAFISIALSVEAVSVVK